MAKKGDFIDPLSDIDPIMEDAFSVTGEGEISEKPAAKKTKKPAKKKRPVKQKAPEIDFPDLQEDEPSLGETVFSSSDSIEKPAETGPVLLDETAVVSDVDFPDLKEDTQGRKLSSGLFSNIPINVSVELGRSSVSLKDVFELTEGSIIELERLVGEPLDLVVNGQVVAQGEVVAIDNNYGLRVTNIVASHRR